MEFFNDFIAVSVDLTLLGFCVREYVHSRRAFQVLKTAPQYKIDGQLKSIVERQPGKKIPYAVIRGSVSPISTLPDHKITNGMIYELRNQEHGVEIGNTIGAVVLNVDLVYDDFNHSSSSVFDHVCGFFSGVRQRRLQTAEEVLREGSFLTAFGELKLDGDTLRLQSSQKGPLLITTASKRTLFKRLENVNKD
ncbi:mitochondrial E3 ubiquitin protein ligase 1-like isoform X2 [Drosophila ficusphila]|uniref:mitochondrial E3 ubiquitin protein ligase 1-like isoform X2 n=1 Tax=Drosophila ficusphila TaxID=30025 RepID=UPI0007E72E4E|nr:mitochondrial E3 ubiquitin protein ligase 1-like isoform X2 [Drosophila ficusphila]